MLPDDLNKVFLMIGLRVLPFDTRINNISVVVIISAINNDCALKILCAIFGQYVAQLLIIITYIVGYVMIAIYE